MPLSAHKIIENLSYTNNCVRALSDKVNHCEKRLEFESASLPPDVDVICGLSHKLASMKEERAKAYDARALARAAIDELFASLRG
jgi:hypothetical protein